jgi:tetratricopeptide (TPR) repeat protein
MNILAQYLDLARAERWEDALPIIEQIVSQAPHIPTSWHNYGVCLESLGRHSEAAEAFQKAYGIEANDGTLYRTFRNLALANDEEGFLRFLDEQSLQVSGLFDLIDKDDLFSQMRESYLYGELKRNRG